jgi:hypothetical protein
MSGCDGARTANDNQAIFDDFMRGYWNQMAPDLYSSFDEAVADFKKMEGAQRFSQLLIALRYLQEQGGFPRIAAINQAYDDPFWAPYGLILTIDDLTSSREFL